MIYKKTGLYYGSVVLFVCCMSSCRQAVNKTADENRAIQIPAMINDSILLSVDKSPMDMSYFPEDYPKEKMINSDTGDLAARIIYSRPQKKARLIFADSSVSENVIQHYGEDWRLGANEATEIEFFKDVSVNGKNIHRGRYILYCIPFPDKWKIIFNTNLFSWGLHIDKTKDLTETELPVTKNNTETEFFTMVFQKAAHGCNLLITWGDIKVVMPISFD
jgi:hypothetical protein